MYGAKVSRQGFDVATASDKQLAFSSEWPLLPIEAEGTINLSAETSYDQVVFTHGLGYAPVFYFWEENGNNLYSGGKLIPYNVYATTTTLYLEDYVIENCTLHYKIFRRPILTNYSPTTLESTDATETDSADYGISVSIPTKDISSTDKRDFSVRSDIRQLMVHMSGYTGVVDTLTATHNLGYPPIYWLYLENTDRNPAGAYSFGYETDDLVPTVSTTQLSVTAAYAYRYAYIIFKDSLTSSG